VNIQEHNTITAAVLSNAAKALEKQHHGDLAARIKSLESRLLVKSTGTGAAWDAVAGECVSQLEDTYPGLFAAAREHEDRGVLRALTWGEKVTKIQKSLLARYQSQGEALLEGKHLYVCQACGFIAVADSIPEICPVCKAPASRFSQITGKEVL